MHSKYDYLKLGNRSDVHTTIREDLYEKIQILSIKTKQPITKILDMLIEQMIEHDLQDELILKVKNYH